MSACIVWLDTHQAKVFKISTTGVEKKTLKHDNIHPDGAHHDHHKHNAEEKFYHDVALAIGTAEELLVFGAGVAKNHFKTHLEKHHHTQLAKHIVGVETLDNVSDNQILEAGRKFFKKFNTYNSSI